jgi:hypothetical protein
MATFLPVAACKGGRGIVSVSIGAAMGRASGDRVDPERAGGLPRGARDQILPSAPAVPSLVSIGPRCQSISHLNIDTKHLYTMRPQQQQAAAAATPGCIALCVVTSLRPPLARCSLSALFTLGIVQCGSRNCGRESEFTSYPI